MLSFFKVYSNQCYTSTNPDKINTFKASINVCPEDDLKKFLHTIKNTNLYLAILILSTIGLYLGELYGLIWQI